MVQDQQGTGHSAKLGGWCLLGRLGKQNNKIPRTKKTQQFGDAQGNDD